MQLLINIDVKLTKKRENLAFGLGVSKCQCVQYKNNNSEHYF